MWYYINVSNNEGDIEMELNLPKSVQKRLKGTGILSSIACRYKADWEQPIKTFEFDNTPSTIKNKVTKVIKEKHIDMDENVGVLFFLRTRYDSKVRLEVDYATVDTNLTDKVTIKDISYLQRRLKESRINKIYFVVVPKKAKVKKYVDTFENDIFNRVERLHGKANGNFYKTLNGEEKTFNHIVGYIAHSKDNEDKWNFASLEKCLDKSGYYFNPLTIQRKLEEYKEAKFTKELKTGIAQHQVYSFIKQAMTSMQATVEEVHSNLEIGKPLDSNFTDTVDTLNSVIKKLQSLLDLCYKQAKGELQGYYNLTQDKFNKKLERIVEDM